MTFVILLLVHIVETCGVDILTHAPIHTGLMLR